MRVLSHPPGLERQTVFIHRFDPLLFDKALMKFIILDHGTPLCSERGTAAPLTCYLGVKLISGASADSICLRSGSCERGISVSFFSFHFATLVGTDSKRDMLQSACHFPFFWFFFQ